MFFFQKKKDLSYFLEYIIYKKKILLIFLYIETKFFNLKLYIRHIKSRQELFLFPLILNFRSNLRDRLNLHRYTVCKKPRTYGHHEFHMIHRYLCQHSHF